MSDTDIVERLNRFKTLLIKSGAAKPEAAVVTMIAEAIDTIERLRSGRAAVLAELVDELLAALKGLNVAFRGLPIKAPNDRMAAVIEASKAAHSAVAKAERARAALAERA